MGSGVRFVALAVAAISLSAAQQPKQNADHDTNNRQVQDAPPYAPYGPLSGDPCYRSQNHDTADLCAQWRAAFAAEKAARAAQQAVVWTIVGTVLSFAALAALIWTLRQTERALAEAKRGNEISEKTAERELRPWIKIETIVTKFVAEDDGFQIGYETIFTNIGQTVAEDFTFQTAAKFFNLDIEDIKSEFGSREPKEERFALMPGEDRRGGGFHSAMKRSLPWHGSRTRKTVSYVVTATAFYRSAPDDKWHRTDRSFLIGRRDDSFNSGYFLYDDMRGDDREMVTVRMFVPGETT
jgi:hypothetical protein